ncbi:hypothetical protein AAMO2058_001392000 [Amorphochlora amoebiformis]|mmetsp:Transcript_31119/g.49972  ORF Transcript_31119/g.49972 Transcript_31119/m.49972 type:complete len:376 (-) Transcript_31119:148-1275(-)
MTSFEPGGSSFGSSLFGRSSAPFGAWESSTEKVENKKELNGFLDFGDGKDIPVKSPPDMEGVSSLSWIGDRFVFGSTWGSKVYCWEVDTTIRSRPVAVMSEHKAPVLSTCSSGSRVFSAGCDQKAIMWDIPTNTKTVVGKHDAPIKVVRHTRIEGTEMLVTGAWDKSVKVWDLRERKGVMNLSLPKRVYAMDVQDKTLVVGMPERTVEVFNLKNPHQRQKESQLSYQIRYISCMPSRLGYIASSISGRCSLVFYNPGPQPNQNFKFKCHRHKNDVYSVNCIDWVKPFQDHVFLTCGGDGSIAMWNKKTRQRLKASPRLNQSISCCKFSESGNKLAYALSYDYTMGEKPDHILKNNRIFLQRTTSIDDQGRPRARS